MEYLKLKSDLETWWKRCRDHYDKKNLELRQEREKDSSINCILFYKSRKEDDPQYKCFKNEQSALEWIHKRENRGILDESCPFVDVFKIPETDDLKISDFKVIKKVEVKDPATGSVLVAKEAAYDTGAEDATFAYGPKKFKSLVKSMRTINDNRVPIAYVKLKIKGEELSRIFEMELEYDPEEQSENEEWNAIGIKQMQDLSETTRTDIMQDTLHVFAHYKK